MIYVFMGMQGSGKGTQAKFLCRHLGLEHISLGEIFRKEIAENTQLGASVKKYLSHGHLVPDRIVEKIVENIFKAKQKGFVFDGFPRTLNQAVYLALKYPVKKVIYLKLDDNIAKDRMLSRRICSGCKKDTNLLINPPKEADRCDECGGELVRRADDTIELIEHRLDLYHQETQPLIDYYHNLGLLCVVNAVGDVNVIHQHILEEIEK